MTITFVIGVTLILYLIIAVNKTTSGSVRRLANPTPLFKWNCTITDEDFEKKSRLVREWTDSNEFQFNQSFIFQEQNPGTPIMSTAWWSESTKTWCLFYLCNGNTLVDFVTLYENDISLTTGSTKDGQMLPKPQTAYAQTFTNLSVPELYAQHLKGCSFVEKTKNAKLSDQEQLLREQLPAYMSRQSEYIMSLPFWNFRGIYWFFIRRNILANKNVWA